LVRTIRAGQPRGFRPVSDERNGDTANETNSELTINAACCGIVRAGSPWRVRALTASAWHRRKESQNGTLANGRGQEPDASGEDVRKPPAAHELDELIELSGTGQSTAVGSSVAGAPGDQPGEASLAAQQDDIPFAEQQEAKGSGWGAGHNQYLTESNGAHHSLSPLSTATRENSQQRIEVWLHVYDLGPVTGRLNEMVLRSANLGAFHCGIEVLGDEWSFQGFHDAWDDPTISGVVRNEPRLHPAYIYRESLMLGHTPLNEDAIDFILDTLMEEWPANSYHLVARNCVTFAEEFAQVLQAPEPFPTWVRGAVDACKAPPLEALTNCGWDWFKWWSQRQAEQEALAEMQAAAGHRS